MTQKSGQKLLLGIDLGTARTAMMSNRGAKIMVNSVVGYPKDIIGVKILNRTQVIGDEAVEKRQYLDLYYPLEDGVLKEASEKDLAAARELIKYAIAQAKPQEGEMVCGILGVPARASVANKGLLLKIAKEMLDISMVVSEPFMVAYGLGKLNNALIIDIGAGTIDICAMKGTVPGSDNQATILKGGNYIDELLENVIAERYPEVQITRHLACRLKEKHAFVGPPTEKVVVSLRANGKPAQFDITEEIRVTCETIVEDIVEKLQQLVTVFDPEQQEEALKNIWLAGGGSNIRGLDALIVDRMKDYGEVKVFRVEDPDYAGCAGALRLAAELPPEYWSQIGDRIGA
ncbi:MAG: rod shape-determining protein [Magnetococcales bacterium]|nr:rod shape-determining protein [Magnetococcales bacterium]